MPTLLSSSRDSFAKVNETIAQQTSRGYLPAVAADFEAACRGYARGYAKRRYQFVLARVLFCKLTYTDLTGGVQAVHFYKDGTVGTQGVTDPTLLVWAAAPWSGDYNMAFWEMRNAARRLMVDDAAFTFGYDAGLARLLAELG